MENELLKLLWPAILTALVGLVTYHFRNQSAQIKELITELKVIREDQGDMKYNYVDRFREVREDIYKLASSFSNYTDKISQHFEDKFEEIRKSLEGNSNKKHTGLLEDFAQLESKMVELQTGISKLDKKVDEFYQQHDSALKWIEGKRLEEQSPTKRKLRAHVQ